jgi:hypothetical protein
MPLKHAVAAFVIGVSPLVAAQTKHPDFSGQWRQDIEASKTLTEQKGLTWRVAGAGSNPGGNVGTGTAVPPGATVLSPVTTITQSDKELVLERRLDNEIISRDVYKLDGTTSVNASRISTTRSTTTWKGAALVTTGTLEMDASDGQFVDKNGKPLPSITRQFVTTRVLMPDGTMQIENRSVQNGEQRVTWSVLVRVKPS